MLKIIKIEKEDLMSDQIFFCFLNAVSCWTVGKHLVGRMNEPRQWSNKRNLSLKEAE